MEEIAKELLKIARQIVSLQDEKVVGNGCRMEWDNFKLLITELPAKGKKRLRIFRLSIWPGIRSGSETRDAANDLIIDNLMDDGKVGKSSTYDQAKRGIEKAVEAVLSKWEKEGLNSKHWVTMGEDQVHYLKVEPEDAPPLDIKGKDFKFRSTWTNFRVRDSHNSPHEMDPSYTDIESKSPAAARKLYKMLQMNPDALRGVSISGLGAWLDKNRIPYDLHFSQWS